MEMEMRLMCDRVCIRMCMCSEHACLCLHRGIALSVTHLAFLFRLKFSGFAEVALHEASRFKLDHVCIVGHLRSIQSWDF